MMEELYQMVVKFFVTYGWQLGCIALSGIVLLGLLKLFGVFNKIAPTKRKYVYVAVSVVFSVAGCAAYLLIIGNFDWKAFLVMVPLVYAANQTAYGVYENTGVRAALRAIFRKIINRLKKVEDNRMEESAKKALEQAQEQAEKVKEMKAEEVKEAKVEIRTVTKAEKEAQKKVSKKDI